MRISISCLAAVALAGCVTPDAGDTGNVGSQDTEVGEALDPPRSVSNLSLGWLYYDHPSGRPDSLDLVPLCEIIADHNLGSIESRPINLPDKRRTLSRDVSADIDGIRFSTFEFGGDAQFVRSVTVDIKNRKIERISIPEANRIKAVVVPGPKCQGFIRDIGSIPPLQLTGVLYGDPEFTVHYETGAGASAGINLELIKPRIEASVAEALSEIQTGKAMVYRVEVSPL